MSRLLPYDNYCLGAIYRFAAKEPTKAVVAVFGPHSREQGCAERRGLAGGQPLPPKGQRLR